MENATKALIIAGAILIAILIITMGLYLRNSFSETSDSYFKQLDAVELQKYNAYFEVYVDLEKNITAQEIVTLISLVQQKEQQTKIYIDGDEDCITWTEQEKNKFLEENILTYNRDGKVLHSYSYVDGSIDYDDDGKVIKISFEKNL